MVSLFILLSYLLVGAFAFENWEAKDNWTLGGSLYFCFISLTTIGYGDLVPLNSIVNYDKVIKLICSTEKSF